MSSPFFSSQDGPIEAPPPSGKVEPFHLSENHANHAGPVEADLKNMMEKMNNDMMQRLDGHELMLRELLVRSQSSQRDRESNVSAAESLIRSTTTSIYTDAEDPLRGANSMKVGISEAEDFNMWYPDTKAVASPSFTPTRAMFSMYDDYDLELFEKAEQGEVKRHRSLFAINAKNRSQDLRNASCSHIIRRIVRNNTFAMLCALVVIINSIFIGIEVQLSLDHPQLPIAVNVIQYCFAGFFVVELLMRIVADGKNFFCGEDWKWSWLDLFVVATSVWEILADVLYNAFQIEGTSGLKALRIMRITRIMKVMRLMRVFRFILAFRTLIASISDTLKSLFWALMLLAVIVYVFAVLFTQAVNDYIQDPNSPPLPEREQLAAQRYFASLGDTMLSLFMAIANGVSWHELVAPLRNISIVWVLLFLFYIFFTYFAVLNVVTAVFCQTAVESAQNDHASMVHSVLKHKQAHLDKLRQLFQTLGDEATGVITFKMLEEKMNTPEVRAYFEVLGLDVWDAWSFFKLLDLDQRGDVEIEQFLMGCLRLRGNAKSIDLCKLIHDQAWLLKQQSQFHVSTEKELRRLRKEIRGMGSMGLNSANMVHLKTG